MASLTEQIVQWPILPLARSQSNTYMPLIYSVSDDFRIEFPQLYEYIFNFSIGTTNQNLNEIGIPPLPFRDFNDFQRQLKDSLRQVTGNTSMRYNDEQFDKYYHLLPMIQERIINGVSPYIDNFMNIFINRLNDVINGQYCILHPRNPTTVAPRNPFAAQRVNPVAPRNPTPFAEQIVYPYPVAEQREESHWGNDWNVNPYPDAEQREESNWGNDWNVNPYPVAEQREESNWGNDWNVNPYPVAEQRVNPQVAARNPYPVAEQRVKKWHWMDDDWNVHPFSDAHNEEINNSRGQVVINPSGSQYSYTIDRVKKIQTNNQTGKIRIIELLGGRRRTKRTKHRKTRRKRNKRKDVTINYRNRCATFKQSSTKKSSSI